MSATKYAQVIKAGAKEQDLTVVSFVKLFVASLLYHGLSDFSA